MEVPPAMRRSHGFALLAAAATVAISTTAGAVQTPAAYARRPAFEVATGDPVRVAGELDWYRAPARQRGAWARLVGELGAQTWAVWDRDTGVPRRIWGAGAPAPGSVASATAAERFAGELLARHVALLAPGAAAADFVLVANEVSGGMRTLGFAQRAGGVPVEGGQISFRFKRDRLIMIGSEALPRVPAPASRTVRDEDAAAAALAWVRGDLAEQARVHGVGAPVVLPLVRAGRVDYVTAVPVDVSSEAPIGRWRVYVDVASGKPVARVQTLRFADGTVTYNAPVRQPALMRQDYPANRASLTVNGQNLTSGADGKFSWGNNNPATVTARVTGTQVRVVNEGGDEATTNLNVGPGQTGVWNAAAQEFVDAQIATFVHASLAIDYIRAIDPGLGFLGEQLLANVNLNSECNAFYNNQGEPSINFFRASNQCGNTGRIADIVYHEYGHAVHDHSIVQGVGQFEGALSEGVSDYLAATITNDAAMGLGFFNNQQGPLRDIDPQGSEAVWPDDVDGDPHITGLIIAGALWDLRKDLIEAEGPEAVAVADRLYYEAHRRATDIPTMYFEALAADDDDGDLANGTPHLCLINAAFAAHGLYKIDVDVTAPAVAVPALQGYDVTVGFSGGADQCMGTSITSAELVWRLREQQDVNGTVPMTIGDATITGTIPKQPQGTVVNYQIKLEFSDGATMQLPDNRADPFYEMFVGAVENIYCTDFETDPAGDGWTHGLKQGQNGEGADDWMWQEPLAGASSGDPTAAFDGTRVFGNDLGGGNYNGLYQEDKTNFAQSPAIDTKGYKEVRLQYRRWLNIEDGFFDRATIYADDEVAWQNLRTPNEQDATVHHTDREWRFHDVDLTPWIADDSVTLQWEIDTDQGLHMGGWTLDALCVVGVVEGAEQVCGDGIVSAGEECDDGANNSDTQPDACRADCKSPACGDGVVDGGEQCDDGNTQDDDACPADCGDAGGGTTGGGGGSTTEEPTTGQPGGTSGTGDGGSSGDSDSAGGTGGVTDDGCGCDQRGSGGAAALMSLLLLGLRRRRAS
jgi:cysteine-rich repeat protein